MKNNIGAALIIAAAILIQPAIYGPWDMLEQENKAAKRICTDPSYRKIAEAIGVSDIVSTIVLSNCELDKK